MNLAFLQALEQMTPAQEADLAQTAAEGLRTQLYRLWHIPMRYYVAVGLAEEATGPEWEDLRTLHKEIAQKGCIDLDADRQPCCLTGKPAVLRPKEEQSNETE